MKNSRYQGRFRQIPAKGKLTRRVNLFLKTVLLCTPRFDPSEVERKFNLQKGLKL